VLLCVLWVRSYWYEESFVCPPNRTFAVTDGKIVVATITPGTNWLGFTPRQISPGYHWGPARAFPLFSDSQLSRWTLSTVSEFDLLGTHVVGIRIYAMLVAAAAIGATSWLPYRFTLRTLLIATTLIAIVLGLIVAVI